ncbi:hypothetical protein I79_012436 [Cricetulus griseus]|uniref:Uncharacterized protein n=1 Tax=Cricetulus griseus TaxID=10029 RepID=G3HNU3_CRIGR|nr:hypothetical protein I79_012436 [Cricetulus griseus]
MAQNCSNGLMTPCNVSPHHYCKLSEFLLQISFSTISPFAFIHSQEMPFPVPQPVWTST